MLNGKHIGKWELVRLGRRRVDAVVALNYEAKRAILRHNVQYISGATFLEEIPSGSRGGRVAMVLVQAGWNNLYILRERVHWTDDSGDPRYDDYFELAQRLMWERGITQP